MLQVTEWDIRKTASLLTQVSQYDPRHHRDYFIAADVGFRPSPNLPSGRECFDVFEALPDEHPLKRRFDSGKVRAGYARIPELVSPDIHYGDIVFIDLKEIGLAPPKHLRLY